MPDPDRLCPLLVVTNDYPDEDGPAVITIAKCAQPLYLRREHYTELDSVSTQHGPEWRVQCGNGHVLVVPETDGEDPIPVNMDRILEALDRTAALHPHLPTPTSSCPPHPPIVVHTVVPPAGQWSVQTAFEEGRAYERRHPR
jgi:hypothetical protein